MHETDWMPNLSRIVAACCAQSLVIGMWFRRQNLLGVNWANPVAWQTFSFGVWDGQNSLEDRVEAILVWSLVVLGVFRGSQDCSQAMVAINVCKRNVPLHVWDTNIYWLNVMKDIRPESTCCQLRWCCHIFSKINVRRPYGNRGESFVGL